ncbi:MAG: transposase [Crocinitomix sp.]|nr:transposase [Crocinitomix sp.]
MDKFKNKYRIPSARLRNWDYSSKGAYFITICTQNRAHLFGEIIGCEMQLNETGQLAEKFWMEIPAHFPFVELGNFVVMPNHFHGILIINESIPPPVETPKLGVSTPPTTTATTPPPTINKNGGKNEKWKSNSIGSIINQFKRIVTINARKIHTDFAWQSRFHDHIIRDNASFQRIQTYIANNPLNWNKDKFRIKQ